MNTQQTAITRVNIYRDGATWCYSAWVGRDHDHNDTLEADCEDLAREEVAARFPAAEIRRVADL